MFISGCAPELLGRITDQEGFTVQMRSPLPSRTSESGGRFIVPYENLHAEVILTAAGDTFREVRETELRLEDNELVGSAEFGQVPAEHEYQIRVTVYRTDTETGEVQPYHFGGTRTRLTAGPEAELELTLRPHDDILDQTIEIDPALPGPLPESTASLLSGEFASFKLSTPWPGSYTLSNTEGPFPEDVLVLLQQANGEVVARSSSEGGGQEWLFRGPAISQTSRDYYLTFYHAGEGGELGVGLSQLSLSYEPGPEVGISGQFSTGYLEYPIDRWKSVVLTTDPEGENQAGVGSISNDSWRGRLDTADYTELYAVISGYNTQYGLISYRSGNLLVEGLIASTGAPVTLDLAIDYSWTVPDIVDVDLLLSLYLDTNSTILTRQPFGSGYLEGMVLTEVYPDDPGRYSIGYVYPQEGQNQLPEHDYQTYETKQWLSPWITLTFNESGEIITPGAVTSSV